MAKKKTAVDPTTEPAPEQVKPPEATESKAPKKPKGNRGKGRKGKRRGSPKASTPTVKPKRTFPLKPLKDVLVIPEAFRKANKGDEVDSDVIAEQLGMSSKKNNKFFYLAAASRDYGLSTGGRDTETMTLTELGKQIAHARTPADEQAAKTKAFMSVEPFGKLFERCSKLSDLPDGKYLTNLLEQDVKLPESLHEDFLRLLRENCTYLGITDTVTPGTLPQSSDDGKTPSRALTIAEKPLAFVIMPFTEKRVERSQGFFKELLNKLIDPACVAAGFKVETAVQKGSDIIQSTIINKLLKADLVVCDLTDHNPNVLFELGIRIAKKLPVALIKSSDTGAIFDVDNMMRVETYNPSLWISTIEEDLPKLTDHIKGAWDNKDSAHSYIDILQKPQAIPQPAPILMAN